MKHWALNRAFQTDEGVVRYGVLGSGKDVVLVHGTPWSSYSWHLLLPELSKRYRVFYYDLIGYGQSDMLASQSVSLDVQGNLLAKLIDYWQLTKPSVIAHDYGGATALRAHLLHGCEFSRLQLIDVVAVAPWGSPFFAHVRQFEQAFAGVPDYIHRAIVRAYIGTALHKRLEDDQFDQLLEPWLTAQGKAAFYRQIAQADQKYTDDIEPFYSAIRCPVSILWGENDTWIPVDSGLKLHNAIPHSSFEILPGCGHLAPLETPGLVLQQVKDFFDF
ncbi:MAG: alpha/beta fold hydrolase [Granulosicoccus sp.]